MTHSASFFLSFFSVRGDSHNILIFWNSSEISPPGSSHALLLSLVRLETKAAPCFGPSPGETSGPLPTQLVLYVGSLWNMKALSKSFRFGAPESQAHRVRSSETVFEGTWELCQGLLGRESWWRAVWLCTHLEQSRNPPSTRRASESDCLGLNSCCFASSYLDTFCASVSSSLQC